MRATLSQCPLCDGSGAAVFEADPQVEPCSACGGTGKSFSDPRYRGLFRTLLGDTDVLTAPEQRLLLQGLSALEQRVADLEKAIAYSERN
jgi:hypothetical protein